VDSTPYQSGAARRRLTALAALVLTVGLPSAAPVFASAAATAAPPSRPTAPAAPPAAIPAPASDRGTGSPPSAERCVACHGQLTRTRVVHGALQKHDCGACHRAGAGEAGRCRSRTSSKWALVRSEPELCHGCHDRKDQTKSVHTAVRQGSCLTCHAAHGSDHAGLLSQPREKLCFECHEVDTLVTRPVRHAPVAEGKCLECHDAHGGNEPTLLRAGGSASCLRCHDAKAPTGKGTPSPEYRVDLARKVVHAALQRTDCLGCHEGGHGSDRLKLLKKSPVELCRGCHGRKDGAPYPHGAVVLGDCVVCHDPHASENGKLLTRPTSRETCFLCHQDDLTGRKVVHAPITTTGCDACHAPHGGAHRHGLKGGEGKAACYACHKPVDAGKVKHAAVERYGCKACHDPHGTDHPSLLPRRVNDLCASCHPDVRDGRHATPMSARGHVVGGGLADPRRPGREFSCASCHDPHGSDSPRLLRVGQTAIESCAWCHGDKARGGGLENVVDRARERGPTAGPARASAASGAGGMP
jgi:predicted CXXCH cytochrome family protein